MPTSATTPESLSEAAYQASGCSSLTEFISSSLCHGVKYAYLGDDVSWGAYSLHEGKLPSLGTLQFSLRKLRAHEEPGKLVCFFHALSTSMPSCTHLGIWGVELVSVDELVALCRGIASPLCTLHSLDLDVKLSFPHNSIAERRRLVGDALAFNSTVQQLTVISELCPPEDHWISCSVKDLHVKLEGDDDLDVLLGVFTGLARNTISLTTISITGPYGPLCVTDTSGFTSPTMLDSHKQLGMSLLTNTSLTSLHLYNLVMPIEAFEFLFSSLNKNTRIESFSLCGYPDLPGEVVRMLFTALEKNLHLKSLCLSYSGGEDWPSASSVLNSVRVNGILTNVELDETPLEEELSEEEVSEGVTWEAFSDQLERNGKIAEEMKACELSGFE